MGAEMSVNYNNKRLFAYGNISWQKVLESEYYTATGNRVYNVPTVQSSLVLSYNFSDAFKLHANTIFTSKQLTQSLYDGGGTIKEENIPARAIVNIGGSYELSPLTFELNVYNLFNQKYYQGGNSSAPIRQQGLWFMFNVGVKI
jgi:outer membrane receptor protein involved in Fe transport